MTHSVPRQRMVRPVRRKRVPDMSPLIAVMTLVGILVSVLTVLVGLIWRSSSMYTELRLTVRDAMLDLQKHIVDERGERVEMRTVFDVRLDRMTETLSRVDRDVARLSGRRRDAGSA